MPENDVYQQVIDSLSTCRRVLVTTHVRPDGDALGSAGAMALGMRQKGIQADVLLLSHLPRKYAFIYHDQAIPYRDAETGWPADLRLEDYDALLVVDTGTWSQLPGLKEKVDAFQGKKIVVDHHLTQEGWADLKLVVKEAAAAGEIVAELLEQWDGVKITPGIASLLFLAIASDTGWFQFSNTRPYTMRLAALLMEAGVDTDRLYQLVYQNERKERVSLQTRVMQSMELLLNDRLAVMTVTKEDFEQTGAQVPDTENVINTPLQIATIEVAILITEPRDLGPIRVSLRSKGQIDVAKFAEQFGGGGHARASGLKLEGTLASAKQSVVNAMLKQMA